MHESVFNECIIPPRLLLNCPRYVERSDMFCSVCLPPPRSRVLQSWGCGQRRGLAGRRGLSSTRASWSNNRKWQSGTAATHSAVKLCGWVMDECGVHLIKQAVYSGTSKRTPLKYKDASVLWTLCYVPKYAFLIKFTPEIRTPLYIGHFTRSPRCPH